MSYLTENYEELYQEAEQRDRIAIEEVEDGEGMMKMVFVREQDLIDLQEQEAKEKDENYQN